MISKKQFVIFSCIICIIACVGDFAIMYIYDGQYRGYSQLYNSISSLGASESPVSFQISAWWIILGFLMIIFALGFKVAFSENRKFVNLATWLIIIYGLGEGMGSGFFKADYINDVITNSGKIHDTLGGIGIFAVLILMPVVQKIVIKSEYPWFNRFSWTIFVAGILILVLFSFRFSDSKNNILSLYKGLWQRLLVLDIYIYFLVIVYIMFKRQFVINK
jgi:hypothetical protein